MGRSIQSIFLTEVNGVECRGIINPPQAVADGCPPTMLGVTTSIDRQSHADVGACEEGVFFFHACNHTSGQSALIQFNRAELEQMVEAIKNVLAGSEGTLQ